MLEQELLETELFLAIYSQDNKKLNKVLDKFTEINCVDENGRSPLLLLSGIMNVQIYGSNLYDLNYGQQRFTMTTLARMVDLTTNVNQQVTKTGFLTSGTTALMRIVTLRVSKTSFDSYYQTIDKLCKKMNSNAFLNARCSKGGTAMHYAVTTDCDERILKLLESHGVRRDAVDRNGVRANEITQSIWNSVASTMSLIVPQSAPSATATPISLPSSIRYDDSQFATPTGKLFLEQSIFLAIASMNDVKLNALLNHVDKLECVNEEGYTPLMLLTIAMNRQNRWKSDSNFSRYCPSPFTFDTLNRVIELTSNVNQLNTAIGPLRGVGISVLGCLTGHIDPEHVDELAIAIDAVCKKVGDVKILNMQFPKAGNLLHLAYYAGQDKKIIAILVKYGVDSNALSFTGYRPEELAPPPKASDIVSSFWSMVAPTPKVPREQTLNTFADNDSDQIKFKID